jgi:hypothetical protein
MSLMKRVLRVLATLLLMSCLLILVSCGGEPPQPPPPPDVEKPELTLTGETSRVATTSSITLEGKIGADTTSFVYRLNDGDPKDLLPKVSEGVFSVVVEGLVPGANTIVLEAADAAGNKTLSEVITVIVVDPNGLWGSYAARITACEETDTRYLNDRGYVFVVKLEQTSAGLTGVVTSGIGGLYKVAPFTAQLDEAGVLEADLLFPAEFEGESDFPGKLRLRLEGETFTGVLSYQDGRTCSENDEALATTVVTGTLLKGVGVPPMPPDDALEPNDDQTSATAITLPYHSPADTVIIRGNNDWFRFNVTASSVVSLELTTTQAFAGFTFILHSATGPLGEPRFAYNRATFSTAWGVGPGTYYLEVVGNPYYRVADLPYGFTLSAEPTPDALFEPNNREGEAREITLPFQQTLYLQADDEDWFRFHLDREATLLFSDLVFPGMTLYSTKMDGTGKLVSDAVLYQDDDFFFELEDLPAGTYYLQVKESGTIGPYTLAFAIKRQVVPAVAD